MRGRVLGHCCGSGLLGDAVMEWRDLWRFFFNLTIMTLVVMLLHWLGVSEPPQNPELFLIVMAVGWTILSAVREERK